MELVKHNSIFGTTSVLQERVSEVEKSINKISSLREELEENSKNVKAEVQTSIGAQLHRLHQREIQLLRQVDALISHQSCLLQLQLSRHYQSLGALRSTLQWVNQGGNIDLVKLGEVTLDPIQTRHLHYKPTLQSSLESSIQSFGRVEAKGTSANVLLLPEEEDYGDGDHHVLHKALHDDCYSKIQIHFPKIVSNQEDWLSVLKAENDGNCNESKRFLCEEMQREEKWLRDLEEQFDLDDFEMTEVSETSESVELISHSDAHDDNLWLHPPTHNKDNKSSCNCLDIGNVEIENLDSLNCIPNKATINSKGNSTPVLPLLVPEVSTVCRSIDSKCKAFSECICNDNCLVSCLKEQMRDLKLQDGVKQDRINEVIRATTCIQQKSHDSRDWLARKEVKTIAESVGNWLKLCNQNRSNDRPKTNTVAITNDWLKSKPLNEQIRTFQLPSYLVGFEATAWIKPGSNAIESHVVKAIAKDSACHTESWISTMQARSILVENVQAKAVKEMFGTYFREQTPGTGRWIAHDPDKKVQLDWLVARS